MTEEPYRWVEAIANRREYIEHQLAPGSPIVAMSYDGGALLFTLSRDRQKIFEIYDRIAMGGIGHPGDLERLRMAAIEVCSTEGFTRSAHDVSLRRLANYSLSPALKAAFEQIYGAPYLARLLFAELGRGKAPNLFLRLDYDGSIHTNGGPFGRSLEEFAVISGTHQATSKMDGFLSGKNPAQLPLAEALRLASEAWALGHLAAAEPEVETHAAETVAAHREANLAKMAVEAAVLEDTSSLPMTWRSLSEAEARALLSPSP